MTTEPAYLTEPEAARVLHIGRRTLQRWRVTGEGPPFVRAGARRVIYSRTAIEQWAEARTYEHRAAEIATSAIAP